MGTIHEQHTVATEIYVGRGRDPGGVTDGRRLSGVAVQHPSKISLGTPAVADADFLVKSATGAELPDAAAPGETVTYTPATDGTSPLDTAAVQSTLTLPDGTTDVVFALDVPRNLVVTATATALVAMTVLVSGYDQYRRPLSELFTIAGGGASVTATGDKAFKYVADVAFTAAADASGNTVTLGTGSKLGLPIALQAASDVLVVALAGAQELVNQSGGATVVAADATSASTTTGDARGTVAVNGTLNGSAEVTVWTRFASFNTQVGLAGVAQA